MTFRRLSEYFMQLEGTSLRNKMVEILSSLFTEARGEEIGKLCYLLQGRVVPLFEAIEFGLADKMVIRAIADGFGIETEKVVEEFKTEGDLGKAAEKLKNKISSEGSKPHKSKEIDILEVYDILYKVATSGGRGSQDVKMKLLGQLFNQVDSLSARYIVRIPLAKLRLGFSDMTILDSLSWMLCKTKELRPRIEKAYNVRPDLGFISETVKKLGITGLDKTIPKVNIPILMTRAERLTTSEEIIEQIGTCAVEPKLDGFRLQVHFNKSNAEKNGQEGRVRLFSRNLEDVTMMYPDIVEGVTCQIDAREAIFEGEALAYNPVTHEFLPFQDTVQRKRKYNIDQKAKEIPLKLIVFELLYLDGESLLQYPYTKRREKLKKLIKGEGTVLVSEEKEVNNSKDLQLIFDDAISRGLEGIMAKKLDGIYQAGARGWNWIKLKRSYSSKVADTIDAVVMGYDLGQGKRAGFGIGDFLIGIHNEKTDSFETVAKIGTGLTDEEWRIIQKKCQELKVSKKPNVVEIRADEITRSPVHTAGRVMQASKSGSAYEVKVPGFALRFPRLERFRNDKKPTDATTVTELQAIYKLSLSSRK
jgi:DNA ligase-1